MFPFFVLFVLSWVLVALIGTLLQTSFHIAFGTLPYAEGKYALVLAAFGIAAAVEIFSVNLRRWFAALAALFAFVALFSSAYAGPFLPIGGNALAPMAFTVFCLKYPADCERQGVPKERVVLTSDRVQELAAINTLINGTIRPRRNLGGLGAERWLLYPPSGECHDYAVTKRHELLKRAWPGSLLIAVVLVPSGEGHAVLLVPTDRGDFVLDSLRGDIVRWDTLPYQWLKIMSPEYPQFWRHILSLAPVHSGVFLFLCIVSTDATTASNLPALFRVKPPAAEPLHRIFA
jgi:predicted transglutaminase-like cysteine proteinase